VLDEVIPQHYYPFGSEGTIQNNGRFGAAELSPGGTDSAISTQFISSFSPWNLANTAAGTLEAWVKFTDSSVNHWLFVSKQLYNSDPNVWLEGLAQGPIRFFFKGYSVDSDVSVASLVGCWHHVAATFGPRGMELWIDGVIHGTNTLNKAGMGSQVDSWKIACNFMNACMKGMLDEVRVSNIQRTFALSSPSFRPISRAPSALGTLTYLPFIQSSPSSGCAFGP
jgi:hypothetical protein